MRNFVSALVIATMCASGGAAFAQTQSSKPAAAKSSQSAKKASKSDAEMTVTATCKDGTTYTGKTKKGACAGHGGVKSWEKK